MYYVKRNGREVEVAFRGKRKAVETILAIAKSEGGVTEFAEYSAGKGAWICSPENQYDIRRHDIK